jgi:regulator of RNase E activity RraA
MTAENLAPLGPLVSTTYEAISPELRAKLLTVAVPTLSAVLYQHGYHSRYFTGVKPLNPQMRKFCGAAFTVRSIPIREDLRAGISKGTVPSRNRQAFDAAPPGSVVVCGTGGNPNVAMMGDIMSTSLMTRGIEGVVLDTGVSDGDFVATMPFPVIAAGNSPVSSFASIMVIDHDTPIGFHSVAVFPGDIIVGDANGAVCIPRHLADDLADACIEQERLEVFVLERIKAGAPIDGTYPPNSATMAAYHAWLEQKQLPPPPPKKALGGAY